MTLENKLVEVEVAGGAWEGIHAVCFYSAVLCAVLATAGVARTATGVASVILLFYSIFAVFSSPSYVIFDPSGERVVLRTYRYFLRRDSVFPASDFDHVLVEESPRPPSPGGKGGRGDISYYARVFLERKDGKRLRVYRTGFSGSPLRNREGAFLVAEAASRALHLPVRYVGGRSREGKKEGGDPRARPGPPDGGREEGGGGE